MRKSNRMIRTTYMSICKTFIILALGGLLWSCNCSKQPDMMKTERTEWFLNELTLACWDLNYKFPASYLQARDTAAWFFGQYRAEDSMLLRHASEIKYINYDTALLITYRGDTLALVQLPCSCEWTDEIPFGPRAYDSGDNIILNDFIQVGENSYQEHLTYDLINSIFPDVESRMNRIGYEKRGDDEREDPQYLLVEFELEKETIQLIKVCDKYDAYFYDEYVDILKEALSEYCKNNNVSRLLTPIDVYERPKE